MLNIALTKGRLEKPILEILEEAGLGIDELKDKKRKLIFQDKYEDIRYFLAKSNDTLTYINQGVADVAFVGSDVLAENERTYYELLDMEVGKCQFVLANKAGEVLHREGEHVKIGTKYPTVAKNYFHSRGYDVEIIKIEGSVELAPLLGLADGIVDIMETGNTLRANGLVVLDSFKEISTRCIVNRASFRTKSSEIQSFYRRMKEVVNERHKTTC